jgi:hypothetical protein
VGILFIEEIGKMEIEEFLKHLKEAKKSGTYTSQMLLKVKRLSKRELIIYQEEDKICKYCGTDLSKNKKELKVSFNQEQEPLSIFQAVMLFMIFSYLKKVPYDYASYHECIAGKKFIENIKEISK